MIVFQNRPDFIAVIVEYDGRPRTVLASDKFLRSATREPLAVFVERYRPFIVPTRDELEKLDDFVAYATISSRFSIRRSANDLF